MARVCIAQVWAGASAHSLAHVVQQYTGLPLPEAQRVIERVRRGERVELDLDDDYAAYDMAGLLTDLGAPADVDESR